MQQAARKAYFLQSKSKIICMSSFCICLWDFLCDGINDCATQQMIVLITTNEHETIECKHGYFVNQFMTENFLCMNVSWNQPQWIQNAYVGYYICLWEFEN